MTQISQIKKPLMNTNKHSYFFIRVYSQFTIPTSLLHPNICVCEATVSICGNYFLSINLSLSKKYWIIK